MRGERLKNDVKEGARSQKKTVSKKTHTEGIIEEELESHANVAPRRSELVEGYVGKTGWPTRRMQVWDRKADM